MDDVSVRLIRFSGAAWTYGVLDTKFEDVPARITSPARTIVDCFRFQRLVGPEAALEALQDALQDKKVTTEELDRVLSALPSRRLSTILKDWLAMNRNIAESVRARLFDRHGKDGTEFELLLVRYACERFLFRLGESAVSDKCILKGATLLALWMKEPYRATRDIDILALGSE